MTIFTNLVLNIYIIKIVLPTNLFHILNELNVEVRDEQPGALNYYYDQIFKEIEE